jgi:hypothetical protein
MFWLCSGRICVVIQRIRALVWYERLGELMFDALQPALQKLDKVNCHRNPEPTTGVYQFGGGSGWCSYAAHTKRNHRPTTLCHSSGMQPKAFCNFQKVLVRLSDRIPSRKPNIFKKCS